MFRKNLPAVSYCAESISLQYMILRRVSQVNIHLKKKTFAQAFKGIVSQK